MKALFKPPYLLGAPKCTQVQCLQLYSIQSVYTFGFRSRLRLPFSQVLMVQCRLVRFHFGLSLRPRLYRRKNQSANKKVAKVHDQLFSVTVGDSDFRIGDRWWAERWSVVLERSCRPSVITHDYFYEIMTTFCYACVRRTKRSVRAIRPAARSHILLHRTSSRCYNFHCESRTEHWARRFPNRQRLLLWWLPHSPCL